MDREHICCAFAIVPSSKEMVQAPPPPPPWKSWESLNCLHPPTDSTEQTWQISPTTQARNNARFQHPSHTESLTSPRDLPTVRSFMARCVIGVARCPLGQRVHRMMNQRNSEAVIARCQ